MRDFQQSRVYKAERLAQECCFPVQRLALDECQILINKAAKFTKHKRTPKVADGRGRRSACFAFGFSGCYIKLPKWARTPWTVLHEYAHAITNDGHGRNFVSTYIKLIRRFIGKAEADILKLAYKQYQVKIRGN